MFIYGAIDDLYQKTCVFQNLNYFFSMRSIRLSTVMWYRVICLKINKYHMKYFGHERFTVLGIHAVLWRE